MVIVFVVVVVVKTVTNILLEIRFSVEIYARTNKTHSIFSIAVIDLMVILMLCKDWLFVSFYIAVKML